MSWTNFYDMHSGGKLKVPPYGSILIELPRKDAIEYFQKRFDQDPLWIACECCGENYDIREIENISTHMNYKDKLIISKEDMKNENSL